MTNLYNNAQFFGPQVEAYIDSLVGLDSTGKQNPHFRVPFDLELKVQNLAKTSAPLHGETGTRFEGYVFWQDNKVPFPMFDNCFYGAILVEQNPRFWAYRLDADQEGSTLQEIPVDDPVLSETLVELIDSAGFWTTNPETHIETFALCPNVWKAIKPYKELHSPLGLKAIPVKRDTAGNPLKDSDGNVIPVDMRDYGSRVIIRRPEDACNNPIPEWHDAEWTVNCTANPATGPYVEVVEKLILLLKPEAATRDAVAGWKFPACYYTDFDTEEEEGKSCLPKSKGGLPF